MNIVQGCEDREKGAFKSAWQEGFLEEMMPELVFKGRIGVCQSEQLSARWPCRFVRIHHDPLTAHSSQASHWLLPPDLALLVPLCGMLTPLLVLQSLAKCQLGCAAVSPWNEEHLLTPSVPPAGEGC